MKRNRRPPKEVQKYMVVLTIQGQGLKNESFKYFQTFNDAKAWAEENVGSNRCSIYKINHDFLGDVERE